VFRPEPSQLLVAAGLVLAALTGVTLAQVWRRRGARAAAGLLALRVAVLALVAGLIWQIFWNYEEVAEAPQATKRLPRVVVLQDASDSMTFQAGGRPRAAQADATWETFARLAAARPAKPEVTRLLFAGGVAAPAEATTLRRDSTQLAAALRRVLTTFRLDALLIISDGASTDGQPPAAMLDWARNRRVPLYAVAAGGATTDNFDLVAAACQVESLNPELVTGTFACHGPATAPVETTFEVDGQVRDRRQAAPAGQRRELFKIPADLAQGWHECAVAVTPVTGEITDRNNRQLGIFQVAPPQKVLFVHDAPKLENRLLVQLLRQYFPDQLEVATATDPRLASVRLPDYLLVILADVSPGRLPKELQAAAPGRRPLTLVLTGTYFKEWLGSAWPGFPVKEVLASVNLAALSRAEGTIQVPGSNRQPNFRHFRLDALRLNLFDAVELKPGARAVLTVASGDASYPLLVADDLDQPTCLVLTSDVTWKWGLNPDPRVRSDYHAFWRVLLNWATGGPDPQHELQITFEPRPDARDLSRIKVSYPNPGTAQGLSDVKLQVRRGQEQASVPVRDFTAAAAGGTGSGAWVCEWGNPYPRPVVVWFRATAQSGGRELNSADTPLLLPADSAELLDTRPQPERLQALVAHRETQFAPAGAAEPVLRKLLDDLQPPARERAVRRRDWHRELLFAAIIVLLLGAEWALERTLKERSG
jgi:hypothetical protein